MNLPPRKSNDPLEGKTLETILTELVENVGWDRMGRQIRVNCFRIDPSIKSSLHFLRRTPWARSKVERLYLQYLKRKTRQAKPNKKPFEKST